MKDEAKSHLKKILVDYDDKLAEAERVEAAKRAADLASPGQFETLKTGTIRPAVQEIADLLNERGHKASVVEQGESSGEAGVKSAAISLRVVPRPFVNKSTETNPITIEVTFSANRGARRVSVSSTNTMINHGGTVGKLGEHEIDAVTADIVASHVIQTLHESFTRTR